MILAQSSWLCVKVGTVSQRHVYVKTCLKSLTVVHLFYPVAGMSTVQMGNDIWELDVELHFQTEMSPLCSTACCSWLWDVSDDACLPGNVQTACHAESSHKMYLWESVGDAACSVFSKCDIHFHQSGVSAALYLQEKTSNHYLFFLPPHYQLTRLHLEQQTSSRWNEGNGWNSLLSKEHHIKITIFSHYSKQKATFVEVCSWSRTG